jgi:hypothetical protein
MNVEIHFSRVAFLPRKFAETFTFKLFKAIFTERPNMFMLEKSLISNAFCS